MTIEAASAGLARLALDAAPDELVRFELGIADAVAPLFVVLDRAPSGSSAVGPINVVGKSKVTAGKQVLLLWLPGTHSYLCLGQVTPA